MTPVRLISRLLRARPLCFLTKADHFLLRNGKKGAGGFELVGTSQESAPLSLDGVMSYDELALSALVGVSVPTHFINNGGRFNEGEPGKAGSFVDRGIYTGLVGARFEREERMEWRHMVVTPTQNRPLHGYGREGDLGQPMLRAWARFYGVPHFASYDEASADRGRRFRPLRNGHFLDALVYGARLRRVIEPFLLDANDRAGAESRSAYVHAVGLGLGVWKLSRHQRPIMLEVYADILRERELPHIAHLDFSWFDDAKNCGGVPDGGTLDGLAGSVRVHFSQRNPAAPLTGDAADCLVTAMYPWDAGAFPGNEYWAGSLSASGDPAAACCSNIPELQNPDVNPKVSGDAAVVFGEDTTSPIKLSENA